MERENFLGVSSLDKELTEQRTEGDLSFPRDDLPFLIGCPMPSGQPETIYTRTTKMMDSAGILICICAYKCIYAYIHNMYITIITKGKRLST